MQNSESLFVYHISTYYSISCPFSSCRPSKKPNLSHQVWPKPGFHMLKARPSPKPIPFVFIRHLGKWPVKDSMVSPNDRWSWLVQVCQFLALSSQLKERWDLECSWHHRHRPSNTEGNYLQLRIVQLKETSLFLKKYLYKSYVSALSLSSIYFEPNHPPHSTRLQCFDPWQSIFVP